MKRIILALAPLAFNTVFFTSCESKDPVGEQEGRDTLAQKTAPIEPLVYTNQGITLTEVVGSPEFSETKLTLKSPTFDQKLGLGAVDFKFSVLGGDYTLGMESSDAATKGCANSDKGQHIHVIVDNHPYEAAYDTNYTLKDHLTAGNHVALAFISRSYHESLKHKEAYQLTQFKVGDDDNMDHLDMKAAHLFYSRPKGEYKAQDVNQVMLDFYLVNTDLCEGGNYVKVTFNNSIDFKITTWAPFLIKGLPLGDNKIELKLMDAKDELIPGPYNAVVREFTLVK